jgi:crossover junction endodeoxyribonuclease RuvC
MITVGIDSGQKGGIAALNHKGQLVGYTRMPVLNIKKKKAFDLRAADTWLKSVLAEFHVTDTRQIEFVVEQVHAMPKQGVSSSFQFGRMYGGVEAWAVGTGVSVMHFTPSVWKPAMQLTTSKQVSLDAARLRFGDLDIWQVKANDGIAEAALLAAYWQQQRG